MFKMRVDLWVRSDSEAEVADYEQTMEALMQAHGGSLVHVTPGDELHEGRIADDVHHLSFPDRKAFDAFLSDPRREAMASVRDTIIEHTIVTEL